MFTLTAIFHDTENGEKWPVTIWQNYATAKAAGEELRRLLGKYDGQRVTIADWEISKTEC